MSKINVYSMAKKVTVGARELMDKVGEVERDIAEYKNTLLKLRDRLNQEAREKELEEKKKRQRLEEELRKKKEEEQRIILEEKAKRFPTNNSGTNRRRRNKTGCRGYP